jgi:hypothetical protein
MINRSKSLAAAAAHFNHSPQPSTCTWPWHGAAASSYHSNTTNNNERRTKDNLLFWWRSFAISKRQ